MTPLHVLASILSFSGGLSAFIWRDAGEAIIWIAGVLAAFGVIYRTVVRPIVRFFVRIGDVMHRVESEFRPNGGSSLRDAVNRIEDRLDRLERGEVQS